MNTSVLYDYMLRHTYTSPRGLISYDHWRICHSLCNEKCRRFISDRRYCDHFISAVESLFKCPKGRRLQMRHLKSRFIIYLQKKAFMFRRGIRWKCSTGRICIRLLQPGKSIIIYTSKVNASIFPRADLAENTVTVIELICRYMDPKKVKIRQ